MRRQRVVGTIAPAIGPQTRWPSDGHRNAADEEPSWYYNTGTWIAVLTHDVLLPRERVQSTFLRGAG